MKKGFFSMTRHGMVNLKGGITSDVQCSGVGHETYKYAVGILYAPNTILDEHGWLIDNNAIDAAIQKVITADSCERMLLQITNALIQVLDKAGLPVLGFKILLRPAYVADQKVADFCYNLVLAEDFTQEVLALAVETI